MNSPISASFSNSLETERGMHFGICCTFDDRISRSLLRQLGLSGVLGAGFRLEAYVRRQTAKLKAEFEA